MTMALDDLKSLISDEIKTSERKRAQWTDKAEYFDGKIYALQLVQFYLRYMED